VYVAERWRGRQVLERGSWELVPSIVAWLGGLFLIGVIAGLIIGRWWSLLLAVLVPVAFVPAGDDSDGAPEWQTALVLLAPFTLVGLAVGVAARRAWERRRRPEAA
jgi:Mg/Co/Ni transporter MgtE